MTDIDTRPLYEPVDENLENFRRRTFLKALGVSFAAFATPGCDFRKPTGKIVPYLVQEENALPGVATWYASTCGACPAQCGTLVKSRDGRPIKLEGNKENPISHGALCARGQASVLDLYDSRRNKNPGESANGESRSAVSWSDMDQTLQGHLSRINQQGGEIRILTPTLASPSREAALETFLKAFNSARHLVYDSLGAGSILQAHKASHGVARLPRYQFDKARVIVSLDADFLGTWLSPVEFAKGWSIGRRGATDGSVMSWHVQIESRMSLTGASADLRVPVRPSALKPIVIEIARKVSESLGVAEGTRLPHREGASPVAPDVIESIASRLIAARGRSLVVSGSADVDVQILANFLNHVLANYGRTLDLKRASLQYSDRGAGLGTLIDEMRSGRVKCLIVHEANPVFDHPRGEEFALALKQVPITISMSRTPDETSELMRFSCPDHNPLEGWADAHPQTGVYSLFQPTVAPIFETRSCIESWLTWAGQAGSAYDFLRKTWRDRVFQLKPADPAFNGMWEKAVHDGFHLVESEALDSPEYRPRSLVQVNLDRIPTDTGDFELVTYPTVALGSGAQALNPWLQELPDPVSKVSWGHHASMSPATARKLGVVEGRVVALKSGSVGVEAPAHVQLGMPDGVVAIASGYGRKGSDDIGSNDPVRKMFPIDRETLEGANVAALSLASWVSVRALDRMSPLAKTQTYDHQVEPFTGHRREIVREEPLLDEADSPMAVSHDAKGSRDTKDSHAGASEPEHGEKQLSLWPGHEFKGPKWEMFIDLTACNGCSACVIACQAENNVPVVGKAEVRKRREMHWIRLDRYYSGEAEHPEDNPDVSFMPMLCQHCDNAPCETVCPVMATLQSEEGLNMQVYNRCVGTRYCANNCPYKVRRFNWFEYSRDDDVQNLVLNPDVAVRSRGVMEKCSFCIQRVSAGKRNAKNEGRRVHEDDVMPACAQTCPTDAIVFGDVNDPNSVLSKRLKHPRHYKVLDEVGTRSAVHYGVKIRNRKA